MLTFDNHSLIHMLKNIKRTLVTDFQYRFLRKTGYGDNLLRLRKFRVYHKNICPDPNDPLLYLTLDVEWGSTPYFAQMLDALKEKGVCAYLFLMGNEMAQNVPLLQRILREGHCVGNHTMTHQNLSRCSYKSALKDVEQCSDLYFRLTGETMPPVLRPPYGRIHRPLAKNLYKSGYTVMHWSLHVPDYQDQQPQWQDYENYLRAHLHNGGIILQHSFSPATAENLGRLIDFCRAQGYRFAEKEDYTQFLKQ